MKKLFPLFAAILLLAGAWGLWFFYNQPIETGPVAHNGSNQKIVSIGNYIARGTEPFWYFEYSGSTITWESPSTSGVNTFVYNSIVQTSSGPTFTFNDGSGVFAATVTLGSCSDGMSETQYTGFISVIVLTGANQGTYNGCANW